MTGRLLALAVIWLALVAATPLPLAPPLPPLAPLVPWAAAPLDKPVVELPVLPLPAPPTDLPAAPPAPIEFPAAAKPTAPIPAPRALPCVGAWLGIASESLECGRARLARGEYEDAARALESAVRAAAERDLQIEARYWLAEVLSRRGQFERADWLFRQVAQEQGRQEFGPWALHASGWTALRLGDAARARDAFTQVLGVAHPVPLDVWGRHGLGLALYALGRHEEAEKVWAELGTRRVPPELERDVLFWRADSLGRIGQAADAARELARFTEGGGHPLLGVGLVRLGWWRFRAGVPAESVDAFRTYLGSVARPAGTERDWAEAGLALALIATGEADDARDALRALQARRSPLATAVRLRLAAAALESGQVPQAQALTQELLAASLGPGIRPWVLLVKGEAHRAEGNRDEARTQFELARAVDPTSTTGRHAAFRLALTNFEMREFGQAVADLAPIVGAPAPPEMLAVALILQGEAAYHAGEYATAAAAYQRVLAEIPDVPQAPAIRRALAWTALRQGQPDEARRQFVEFAQAYPADPQAVDALVLAAELALETGALEPGRELLERVVADHAGHPRVDFARLNRAILLVRTGRAAAALPMLRDWIARAPFPPLVGRAWAAFGVSLLATGNSAEAASAFEHARQEGLGALAALGLGVVAVAATRLDDAAREFEAARDTGPLATAAIAEYGLAVTAFHRGAVADFRKTAETILQAAPRGPLAPGVLYVLAGIDAEAKNWPAALGEAKRLVADFPTHEAADDGLERVGAAAARAGAWPVASEAYALLRQRYPQSPFVEDSRLAWAEALLETGRAAEARQALEAAGPADGDPGGPAALLALGRAREATGDQAGALDAFSRAAGGGDSSGWSRPATLSYARVLGAERRWEDARRVLEPLLRVAEPAAVGEAAVAIGDIYHGEGQALAAAEYYMTAAYLAPESPAGRRALVAAGRSFAALKQSEAAAVVYQKLLAQSDVPADLAAAARQGLAEVTR